MDCPVCGNQCTLTIAGYDEFGTIREWFCMECCWSESDLTSDETDDIVEV